MANKKASTASNRRSSAAQKATLERRSSSAAGSHGDSRTKRLKTRAARDNASKREF
jgi:hypothetical protein